MRDVMADAASAKFDRARQDAYSETDSSTAWSDTSSASHSSWHGKYRSDPTCKDPKAGTFQMPSPSAKLQRSSSFTSRRVRLQPPNTPPKLRSLSSVGGIIDAPIPEVEPRREARWSIEQATPPVAYEAPLANITSPLSSPRDLIDAACDLRTKYGCPHPPTCVCKKKARSRVRESFGPFHPSWTMSGGPASSRGDSQRSSSELGEQQAPAHPDAAASPPPTPERLRPVSVGGAPRAHAANGPPQHAPGGLQAPAEARAQYVVDTPPPTQRRASEASSLGAPWDESSTVSVPPAEPAHGAQITRCVHAEPR